MSNRRSIIRVTDVFPVTAIVIVETEKTEEEFGIVEFNNFAIKEVGTALGVSNEKLFVITEQDLAELNEDKSAIEVSKDLLASAGDKLIDYLREIIDTENRIFYCTVTTPYISESPLSLSFRNVPVETPDDFFAGVIIDVVAAEFNVDPTAIIRITEDQYNVLEKSVSDETTAVFTEHYKHVIDGLIAESDAPAPECDCMTCRISANCSNSNKETQE